MTQEPRPPLRVRELTARGRGGISVLELRGPQALERLRALAPDAEPRPGAPRLLRLRRGEELLDEALLWVESPQRAELHLHGSPPLVRRVMAELGADPGNETPAATLEERAEELCAEAASEAAARVLLDQAEGALRNELERLCVAESDAEALQHVDALLEAGRIALHLVRPPQVVLAGPVNAGKSTLFNLLVGRERVVVDAERGTTRDAVRERVLLGEYAVDLIDTAGERDLDPVDAAAGIEAAGQALARALRAGADLVLWLDPRGAGPPGTEEATAREHVRVLTSRADELASPAGKPSPVSARERPEEACGAVEVLFREALALPASPWRPGAPVPFEAAQLEVLEGIRAAGAGKAVRDALDSLLAR